MEAFSDGVMAIIITIMVLEIKVPHGAEFADLRPLIPVVLSYLLSFIYVGIYWNNHHHMIYAADTINGRVLWANLHLLFWLSLVPFATGWMGENHFAPLPVALYGVALLMSAIAYSILVRLLTSTRNENRSLQKALGKDVKGLLSVVIYVVAIPLAFVSPWISISLYTIVAAMWFIPDPRIEENVTPEKKVS